MPFNTANIPNFDNRQPANIPLHSLSSASGRRYNPSDYSGASSLDEKPGRSRRSSLAEDSDFSIWSDTGDLVDQLADDDDHQQHPRRPRFRDSLDGQAQASRHRSRSQQKRVRYADDTRLEKIPKRKEDIRIPSPTRRPISKAARLLATIMAPRDGPSRMHGLHGKKLLSVFDHTLVFWNHTDPDSHNTATLRVFSSH